MSSTATLIDLHCNKNNTLDFSLKLTATGFDPSQPVTKRNMEPIESIRGQISNLLDKVKSIDHKLKDVSNEVVDYINNESLKEKGNIRVIKEVVEQLIDRADEDYFDFYGQLIKHIVLNIDSKISYNVNRSSPYKEGEKGVEVEEDCKGDGLFRKILFDRLEKELEAGMNLDPILLAKEFCNDEGSNNECNQEELLKNKKFLYLLSKEKNRYIGLVYMMCESLKLNINDGVLVCSTVLRLFNSIKNKLNGSHHDINVEYLETWRREFKKKVFIDVYLECVCVTMYHVGKLLCSDEIYNAIMEHFFLELYFLNKWNEFNTEIKDIIDEIIDYHNNNWEREYKIRAKLMKSKRARIINFRGFRNVKKVGKG